MKKRSKKILLIINSARNNGAPVFAVDVCRILKKNGYEVTVWAMRGGKIAEKFSCYATLEIVDYYLECKTLPNRIKNFDAAIAFTIQAYLFYEECKKIIPTIWYIHEAGNLSEYLQNSRCKFIFDHADNMVVVSEYAQKVVWQLTGKKREVLHNFVPDQRGEKILNKKNHKKKRFLVAGSVNYGKAYDIVFDTFLMLDETNKEKCTLCFCGEQNTDSDYAKEQLAKVQNNSLFINYGEISREQLMKLYDDVDVVIVPSRDESCSLVVLEAFMMGKPVIISDSVGASYLVDDENGWMFETDNKQQLKKIIIEIIHEKFNLEKMGVCGRKAFLEGATEQVYEKNFLRIFEKKLFHNNIRNFLLRINSKWSGIYEAYVKSPFEKNDIPRNSKIVLYGAGKYGNAWKSILEKSHYVKLVAWVDKYIKNEELVGLSELQKLEFDYILISIVNPDIVDEVRCELREYVDDSKILIQAECSDELLGW